MISKENSKTRWKAAGRLAKAGIMASLVFVMLFLTAPLLPFSLNLTPSMPHGLYYTYDCSSVKGDIILFKPGGEVWQFALDRGYVTGRMEGMIKTVVATSGDKVCWRKRNIYVNEKFVGEVALMDSMGRPLGHAPECKTLVKNQLLPIAPDYPKSFDGRYFGVINFKDVQSCARPIITF